MELREKKHAMRLLIGIVALTLCVGMVTPVQAASSKNAKAHKAYEKQIRKDQRKYCPGDDAYLYYTHKDLNGDGVDELITQPGLGYCSELVYTYKKGKVKRIGAFGNYWGISKYYKKRACCSVRATMAGCQAKFIISSKARSWSRKRGVKGRTTWKPIKPLMLIT